jgi:hypothetical protein
VSALRRGIARRLGLRPWTHNTVLARVSTGGVQVGVWLTGSRLRVTALNERGSAVLLPVDLHVSRGSVRGVWMPAQTLRGTREVLRDA